MKTVRDFIRSYVALFLKGIAMGSADVVPGVSGGTIAFISGIYDELLGSLKQLTPAALGVWYRQGFQAFWRHINGTFLVVLFSGVLVSIVSLASFISYLLDAYPILVWSFFFGLILASAIYILRQQPALTFDVLLWLLLGVMIAVGIGYLRPAELPGEWWIVFLSAVVAICAMILPGISGSFILLLIGIYSVVIDALKSLDWLLLSSFLMGCVTGLLLFSHALSWLLKHYHNRTLALLTGFLVGSLSIVWPWKHALEIMINRHGETVVLMQENILPTTYSEMTGTDAQLLGAIVCAILGVTILFALEYAGRNCQNEKQ